MVGAALLDEGCLDPSHSTTQPRAGQYVTAARVNLVSIQSIHLSARWETRKYFGD